MVDTIYTSASNFTIFGDGPGISILKRRPGTGIDSRVLAFNASAPSGLVAPGATISNINVFDMSFDGNNGNVTSGTGSATNVGALFGVNIRNFVLGNVSIINPREAGVNAFGCINVDLDNVWVDGMFGDYIVNSFNIWGDAFSGDPGWGFWNQYPSRDIRIRACRVTKNWMKAGDTAGGLGIGICVQGSDEVSVTNCAVDFTGEPAARGRNGVGIDFEGGGPNASAMMLGKGYTASGNTVKYALVGIGAIDANTGAVTTGILDGYTFTGNTITDCDTGLQLNGRNGSATGNSVQANKCISLGADKASVETCYTITGNTLYSGEASGIEVNKQTAGGYVEGVTITGNVIDGANGVTNTGVGIQVYGDLRGFAVTGNVIRNTAASGIYLANLTGTAAADGRIVGNELINVVRTASPTWPTGIGIVAGNSPSVLVAGNQIKGGGSLYAATGTTNAGGLLVSGNTAANSAIATDYQSAQFDAFGRRSRPLPLVVDGTIIRDGVGGPRFRSVGWNNYVMKVAGGTIAQTMSATQREAWMERIRPESLLRVWFYAPLITYTWDQVTTELDAIVASARKYGHRIIASLTDWAGNANDAFGAKSAGWFTSNTWRTSVAGSASLEAWARTLATRYANDPTVAAYDLINEPSDAGAAFTSSLTSFAQEIAAVIRTAAPSALVCMGTSSVSSVGGSTPYQTINAGLDFVCVHHYDAIGYFSSKSSAVVSARAMGKPLLVDEFGIWSKAFYGAFGDTDKDTNGLPAVNAAAQSILFESEIRTALDIPEVFGALVWSAMDSDASWYAGLGMYEPLTGGTTETVLRTIRIPEGRGQIGDIVASMQGWIDAVFTARYAPGTQIGGAASGSTILNLIYDRLNTNYRQSTQANAPSAGRWAGHPTLQFGGTHRFTHTAITTGSGSTHSLYAVIVPTAWPGTSGYILAPSTATNGFSVRLNSSGIVELYRYGSGGSVIGTGTTPLTTNTMWVVEVRWDASSGGWRIRVNGVSDANGTSAQTLASDVASIGAEAGGTLGFTGHILELIKTGASATAQDQTRIYDYLARRWPEVVWNA
jgi:hypothetical protein